MQSLKSTLYFTLSLFFFLNVSKAQTNSTKTIIVDQSGKGNFISVQQAIDSIPSFNQEWTIIRLNPGVYNEKVIISQDKPYIILEGESLSRTVIQWGDFGSTLESATFKLYADNFMARGITFKNTFDHVIPRDILGNITWAPAAYLQADKASFYSCAFIGIQDTLTDWVGRHLYEHCYFEGAIDFIWGGGQSIFQNSIINVTASVLGGGNAYITAQARSSDKETNGFVFKYCSITGTGPAFLGRAYGEYSRVVFYKSVFSGIINPRGWYEWNHQGKEKLITYAEIECTGPGADMSKRVKWEKNLSEEEVRRLVSVERFINQGMWLQEQLIHL
ncbi:hypothetical protein SO802_021042 [Lithocarpus litseifolius]|uniref:pectinesterase n=1 Tax=Lithocarpus litseifolius TaxID=425828 RepID=A0AAW2CF28_9ROSI